MLQQASSNQEHLFAIHYLWSSSEYCNKLRPKEETIIK